MRWSAQTTTEEAERRLPGYRDAAVVRTFDAPEALHTRFYEVHAKSALNKVPARMPWGWTINPYRGCTHACAYCFARPTHEFLEFDAGTDFEREIVVKVNVPEVLRAELARPSWKGEHVALGTNTDPYQWVEGRYELMRGIWQALRDRANPCSVLTKSPLLTRDIDLMLQIAERTQFTAYLSVPTIDERAWRESEPRTPSPRARLNALTQLAEAGLDAGVVIAPLMPGINDGPSRSTRSSTRGARRRRGEHRRARRCTCAGAPGRSSSVAEGHAARAGRPLRRALRQRVRDAPRRAAAAVGARQAARADVGDADPRALRSGSGPFTRAAPAATVLNMAADVARRALALIADGLVDRAGVPGLARRLGYSERQLHRILVAELGAGAIALARAQRAQAARLLIDSADLTLGEIALAAGFGSVRQFNDTMRRIYGTTPAALRTGPRPATGIRLRLPTRAPSTARPSCASSPATRSPVSSTSSAARTRGRSRSTTAAASSRSPPSATR